MSTHDDARRPAGGSSTGGDHGLRAAASAALRTPAELLDYRDLTVVVTGSSTGIGAGVARRFSQAGAAVVLHARTGDLRPVADELPEPSTTVHADLADPDAAAVIVATAVEAFGRLDVVVNNAGIQPLAALSDVSDADWRAMLEVNVTAVHRLTQAAARRMRAQGDGGAILHVASIEGHQPAAAHGHYATAKAAVRMHARAAAAELGADGIRVNTVSPGLIGRPGLADEWPDGVERWRSAAPLTRLGTPEDVGDACVFLCSPLARWITGADLVVDGGVLCRPTW